MLLLESIDNPQLLYDASIVAQTIGCLMPTLGEGLVALYLHATMPLLWGSSRMCGVKWR